MSKKTLPIVALVILGIVALIFYTQMTIFVIQPLGALPEGRTLIISRLNKTKFIDSADAMCNRIQGGVSLLCRGMVISKVLEEATIYAKLPYSEWLYLISTDGQTYEK